MIQFQSQFDAVERPTPRLRMGMGKISPITTQAPGPHVEAYNVGQNNLREKHSRRAYEEENVDT